MPSSRSCLSQLISFPSCSIPSFQTVSTHSSSPFPPLHSRYVPHHSSFSVCSCSSSWS
jgi:hypothetical protein